MMSNEEVLEIVQLIDNQMDNIHDFNQETRKERKMRIVAELFLRTNGLYSDIQLEQILREANQVYSNIPVVSSSSIGRYLIDENLLTYIGEDKYRYILEKRKQNLLAAKAKGGQHFAENNVSLKDKNGEFIGSIPKR